jgi:hypothetical protein
MVPRQPSQRLPVPHVKQAAAACRDDAAADAGEDAAAASQSDNENEEQNEPGGETGTLADLLK